MLVLGGLLVVLDTTVINVAIGRLSQQLGASLPVIQWVLTGYTLALAAVAPATAWAVARLGAKRAYLLALAAFVTGSTLCGLAWDVQTLIAFRVLQGLGGGMLMPVVMTIALRAARPASRGRILAILGVPVLIGPVAGPVLGGWLLVVAVDLLRERAGRAARLRAGHSGPATGAGGPGAAAGRPRAAAALPASCRPGDALAQAGDGGVIVGADVLVPAVGGAGLVLAFLVRARLVAHPLVDIGQLRHKAMAPPRLPPTPRTGSWSPRWPLPAPVSARR